MIKPKGIYTHDEPLHVCFPPVMESKEVDSASSSGKRKDASDAVAMGDGVGSHKRLKRQLTQESDLKVGKNTSTRGYEKQYST